MQQITKQQPVVPVANNPRNLVTGKRCVTLVGSKSLSCIKITYYRKPSNFHNPKQYNNLKLSQTHLPGPSSESQHTRSLFLEHQLRSLQLP